MKTHIEIHAPNTWSSPKVFDLREVIHMEGTKIDHRDTSHEPYRLVGAVIIHLRGGLTFTVIAEWDKLRKEWVDYLKERAEAEAKPKQVEVRIMDGAVIEIEVSGHVSSREID